VARILGLDVGERRIGVAISDPEGRIAVPLRVVDRTSAEATIVGIAHAEQAELIVLGLPLSMDGTVGAQARLVQSFGNGLAQATGLPIEYWDERLSSVQAERTGAAAGRRASRKAGRRKPSDDLAAAIILQGYLDRQRAGREPDST
jgi:putative Holliday junction resolvase